MSIATEIQEYNDGLLSAYGAVSSKGGTVPAQKNLSNLPTAINSIEGGGGGIDASDMIDINGYGRLYYKEITGVGFIGLDINERPVGYTIDPFKFAPLAVECMYHRYSPSSGMDRWDMRMYYNFDEDKKWDVSVKDAGFKKYTAEEIADTYGCTFDGFDPDGTMERWAITTSSAVGEEKYYDITTEEDFLALYTSQDSTEITLSGKTIPVKSITKFVFSKNFPLSEIPAGDDPYAGLFYNWTELNRISRIPDIVTSIKCPMLMYCDSLDCMIYAKNLETCEDFLVSCKSFNSPIYLPSLMYQTEDERQLICECPKLDSDINLSSFTGREDSWGRLLYYCDNMTKTVTLDSLPDGEGYAMYDGLTFMCNGYTKRAYTEGIKLTGDGASAWKSAYPNRYGSTHARNLIVV